MAPSLVAQDGIVYCIGGRSGGALAVRCGGRGDVTPTHRVWTGRKGSNVSSPLLHEGRLYWMHESRGVAYCADAGTGEVLYEERVAGAGQVYASPVLAAGKLYYVSRNNGAFVITAKPEFELLAHNTLGDQSTFDASPAVSGNRLILRSDRFVYCLGGH
jgi:outer membrane protein assembly factor BamB